MIPEFLGSFLPLEIRLPLLLLVGGQRVKADTPRVLSTLSEEKFWLFLCQKNWRGGPLYKNTKTQTKAEKTTKTKNYAFLRIWPSQGISFLKSQG